MTVEMQKDSEVLNVKIAGSLDIKTAPELRKQLQGELQDVNSIIFDLEKTDYTSSAGLRVLLEAFQVIHKKGGTMTMKNVNDTFYDILQISGFTEFLDIQRAQDRQ